MSTGTLLVDAGPLYAYVDADDRHHADCVALAEHDGVLVVPQLVIAEVSYLLGARPGSRAELLFLADVASGAFSTEPVHHRDWLRIMELVARYRDVPLGAVDASVVASRSDSASRPSPPSIAGTSARSSRSTLRA